MHFFGVKLGSVFDCGRKVRRSLTCAARLPTTLTTADAYIHLLMRFGIWNNRTMVSPPSEFSYSGQHVRILATKHS